MKADLQTKIIQILKQDKELSYSRLASHCRQWRRKTSSAERILRYMRDRKSDIFYPQVQVERKNGSIVAYKWVKKYE